MKVFGKFEISAKNVYRTEAYIDLDPCCPNGQYQPPILNNKFSKKIIGTIFMFNPGSSVPINFSLNVPNQTLIGSSLFSTSQYVELVPDPTMDVILSLLCNSCYKSGLIEIKNLFNLREPSNINYSTLVTHIANALAYSTIPFPITFKGDFVFFAWGASLLRGLRKAAKPQNSLIVDSYWKGIITNAQTQNIKICYVTNKSTQSDAENNGAFFHPLGGRGWLNQKYAFKNLMRIALYNQIKIHYKHPNTFRSL